MQYNFDEQMAVYGLVYTLLYLPVQARYFDDASFIYHREELERQFVRRAEPELFI